MDSEKLYRVQEEDLSKLEELLCRSFAADPLYVELIPDEEVRKRLMPELFQCDLTEFYETCEIFADSKKLNGILVVSDETGAVPSAASLFYGGAGDAAHGGLSDPGGSQPENIF